LGRMPYPCPVVLELPDHELELPLSDLVDLEIASDFEGDLNGINFQEFDSATRLEPHLRLRSPIRFDYDPRRAGADHPASHVTLAGDECRCPVFGPLSIGHFVRFIFRYFYSIVWQRHSFIREWPLRFGNRYVSVTDERELFVECFVGATREALQASD